LLATWEPSPLNSNKKQYEELHHCYRQRCDKERAMPRGHPGIVVGACLPCDNAWKVGFWEFGEREKQDAAFRSAMERAIADGTERCPTMPSTCYGTRCPLWGYRRPDE
jgi:hypothetical protein